MLRCTAVQTQSSIVIRHVLKMSKVPRVLGLGFQCTRSVPLPNSTELILDYDALDNEIHLRLLVKCI